MYHEEETSSQEKAAASLGSGLFKCAQTSKPLELEEEISLVREGGCSRAVLVGAPFKGEGG
jgi:hypothetical protein